MRKSFIIAFIIVIVFAVVFLIIQNINTTKPMTTTDKLNAQIEKVTSEINSGKANADNYQNRGLLKYDVQDYKGALEDFAKVKELNKDVIVQTKDINVYIDSANAYVAQKDYKAAMAEYEEALKIKPNSKRATKGKAELEALMK